MKKITRVLAVFGILVLTILPFVVVFALPVGNITDMTANPSNTSMILTWVKASPSTRTLIRYKTDTFSANISDGTQVYFSTGFQVTMGANVTSESHVSGDNVDALAPGQVFYITAWGEVSGNYSVTPMHLVMSTLAVAIPSGAQDQPSNTLPVPTLPSTMNQTPDTSAFNLEPFTSIVNWFNNGPGGLGMPNAYAWESIAIVGLVGTGFLTYTKIRNFFVAYAVVFLLTLFAIGLHLVQGWLFGVEIVIGAGVWGIEHYLQ